MRTGGTFPGGRRSQAIKQTTQLHQVLSLRMSAAIYAHPHKHYGMHSDNFTNSANPLISNISISAQSNQFSNTMCYWHNNSLTE